jgi:hypothetical protein
MYKLVETYKNRITLKTCIGIKYTYIHTVQCDQKENKSEQALQIIGHVVTEFYANKCNGENL